MNVNEMTPEEKSVVLAKLCGWVESYDSPAANGDAGCYLLMDKASEIFHTKYYAYPDAYPRMPNLYDPANMALAWRVLNWVDGTELSNRFNRWYYNELWMKAPPGEAQAAWLDKVLELAIEAGMVPA